MFLFQASRGKSRGGRGGKESWRKEGGGLLARSQTRTHTNASPSLILESSRAPVPYEPRDKQTRRARRPRSARGFPGRSAEIFRTRLCHRTRSTGPSFNPGSAGQAGGSDTPTLAPKMSPSASAVGLCRSRAAAAAPCFRLLTTPRWSLSSAELRVAIEMRDPGTKSRQQSQMKVIFLFFSSSRLRWTRV